MLDHEKRSSSQPPTIGPSAIAIPAVAPHRPIARARSARSVKTLEISESVAGNTIAAPRPMKQRGGDQLPGARGEAAGEAGEPEHGEAGEQHPLAPDAVGEAARGEQQRGEDEVVGVDDPLQLAVGGVQLAHERGQRDVDDRRVEVDREGGEQQRGEDQRRGCSWDDVIKQSDKKIKSLDNIVKHCTIRPCAPTASTARSPRRSTWSGDRWTLLIVRELLLRGSARYTDLRDGPAGDRHQPARRPPARARAGRDRRAPRGRPPPVATTLFALTDRGQELEPVLDALGRWGVPCMAEGPASGDAFRSRWLAWPAELFLPTANPSAPPVTIELNAGGEPIVIEVAGGQGPGPPGDAWPSPTPP